MKNKELHLISNGRMPLEQFASLVSSVNPYITAVHLREKNKSAIELWNGVQSLQRAGVSLDKVYLNDRVDVAYAAGAKGVQLAFHSLEPSIIKPCFPHLRVGRSIHSVEEGQEAERQKADYLLFGHVYESFSKPGLPARGLELLRAVTSAVSIPVIAIGGILPAHLPDILAAGAAGVAVMSGILEASDPVYAAEQYFLKLAGGKNEEI